MSKKIIAIVIAIVLVLSLMPALSLAEEDTPEAASSVTDDTSGSTEETSEDVSAVRSYNIWVAGVEIKEGCLTVDSSLNEEIKSGSAVFDPETNTLTLKDFVYEGKGSVTEFSEHKIRTVVLSLQEDQLNINIEGECSVIMADAEETESDAASASAAILTYGNVLFSGEGSLSIANALGFNILNAGILSVSAAEINGPVLSIDMTSVTQEGGALIGMCLFEDGVFTSGTVSVNVLSPEESAESKTAGISSVNGSIAFNGADVAVNVSGATKSDASFAVYSKNETSIAGGTLIMYCANECENSGAYSSAPLIATGFDVYVLAGDSQETAQYYTSDDLLEHYGDPYVEIAETVDVPTHAITFETNGGTINGDIPEFYYEGLGVDLPSDVTKENCDFNGWYDNAEFSGEPVKVIGPEETTDKVFYAKWTDKTKPSHAITYNTNGGTIIGDAPSSYTEGTVVTLPVYVVKDGNTFDGWYDNAEFTGSPVVAVGLTDTTDKTFYAKWSEVAPVLYTVTYNTDGGTIEGEYSTTYVEGVGLVLPTKVSKEGYDFAGWYDNAELTGNVVTAISASDTGDKVYYAKWVQQINEISEVKISFDYSKMPYFYVGEEIPVSASYGPDNYDGPLVLSDKNCYVAQAVWMYLGEDGEWHPTFLNKSEFEQGIQYAYSVVVYPKDGYYFKPDTSILKEEDGNGSDIFDVGVSYSKMFFSYNFGELTEYTVSFDTDGGTEVESQQVAFGGHAQEPEDPEKEGYDFAGWYYDPEFTLLCDFATDYVVEDETLYAKWVVSEDEILPADTNEPTSGPDTTTIVIIVVVCAAAAAVIIILVVRHHKKKKS